MKHDLIRPCARCPFRSDRPGYLRAERAAEIAALKDPFACHETTVYCDDSDEMEITRDSQHCAGALILAEKTSGPTQMMRIAERLDLYDHTRLDMEAAVFESAREMVAHHQNGLS